MAKKSAGNRNYKTRKQSSLLGKLFKLMVVIVAVLLFGKMLGLNGTHPTDSANLSKTSPSAVAPSGAVQDSTAIAGQVTPTATPSAATDDANSKAAATESSAIGQSSTLDQQLQAALVEQVAAHDRLNASHDAVKVRVLASAEYQSALQQATAAKQQLDTIRSSGGDGLIAADQRYLSLSGAANQILLDAYAADPAVRNEQADVAAKNAVILGLNQQIATRDRLAVLSTSKSGAAQDQNQSTTTTPELADSHSESTPSSPRHYVAPNRSVGVKDEHVSGYTRKDGTHVNSYNRRSH